MPFHPRCRSGITRLISFIAAIFLIASVLDLVDFDVADRVAGDQDGQLVLLAEQEPQKAFPHRNISDGDHAAGLRPAGYTDSQGVLHALTSPRGLCCCCLSSCSHGRGSKRTFFQNFLQLFFSALQAVGYIVGFVIDHGCIAMFSKGAPAFFMEKR